MASSAIGGDDWWLWLGCFKYHPSAQSCKHAPTQWQRLGRDVQCRHCPFGRTNKKLQQVRKFAQLVPKFDLNTCVRQVLHLIRGEFGWFPARDARVEGLARDEGAGVVAVTRRIFVRRRPHLLHPT